MRISELIKRLENVRSEHGDLYVLIGQPDSTGEGDDDLADLTGECMNVETIHSVFQHRVRWGQVLEEGRLVHGCRPFVVHLDEADALLAQRGIGQDVAEMRRVTNLILQRLDQWDVRGVLVCATNLTAMLDPAALRRFDLRLDMPVADEQTAIAIIQSRLVELAMSVDDIAAMAACAAGLAPALIVQAVDTAARRTLLESDITMIDGGLLTGLMEQARVDTGEERRASDA